ncbi:MAG: methylated-DNA--[protein]-cysteine S-methyltransferase [Chloroflexi bacterium]|nr:methylated-DNA--[protein]-cysteine S-methyltransferase [Chloroflexota bacterium]
MDHLHDTQGRTLSLTGRTARQAADAYCVIETVLGPAFLAYNDRGISALLQAETSDLFEQVFQARFHRMAYRDSSPPAALLEAVRDCLAGRADPRQCLEFDLRGRSPFEEAVLRKTAEIPYGQVRPYSWIACEIGYPTAVRAVGSAVGRNPIPLLIPCHRVVRRDGRIGAYGLGGTAAKRRLLAAEGIDPDWLEHLARKGVRYIGDPREGIYCFPTCPHARTLPDERRLALGTDGEAAALGLQPCPTCRPAPRPFLMPSVRQAGAPRAD